MVCTPKNEERELILIPTFAIVEFREVASQRSNVLLKKILNEAVKLNLVKKIPNHMPDHQKMNEKNRPKRRTVSE